MNRRRTAFVKHPIQRKYLKFILAAMCLPTVFMTACLYYLIWQAVAHELAVPELIAQSLLPALQRVNYILLVGIPVVFATIFYFAVQLTHRLAGPIYRIETSLADIIKTRDFKKSIHIRKDDDLQILVDEINTVIREASKS